MSKLTAAIPSPVKKLLRPLRDAWAERSRRAIITEPVGRLDPRAGRATFVVAVGPKFNQNVPNAYMTARMGYCRAFESLGVPYLIADLHDLPRTLAEVPRPVVMLVGDDYGSPAMTRATLAALRRHPHFVWVNPWFRGSDAFFAEHDLDPATWDWPAAQRERILDGQPSFVFTATVPGGLEFFEQWDRHGVPTASLPLACDTTLYTPDAPLRDDFRGVKLAFVGGYWESKGRQIDAYLRPFEDELTIYGYSQWPYRGYRGQLPRDAEPSLYRQALLCPTINEPTVRLLRGQINERVFKVLGCGSATVVDAVPAYRELFTDDELPIPGDAAEFGATVRRLLADEAERKAWARRGYEAVMRRHTYVHRVREALRLLKLESITQTNTVLRPAA
jgi:hypothetical protein